MSEHRPDDGTEPEPTIDLGASEPPDFPRMTTVYIAGPLSGSECQYMANVGHMLRVWRELMEMGFACVCPCADLLAGFMRPTPLDVMAYKRQSMELMRRCDVVYISLPTFNQRISWGVQAEIDEAKRLGIPVTYSIGELAGLM